jgi:hypothetical protein
MVQTRRHHLDEKSRIQGDSFLFSPCTFFFGLLFLSFKPKVRFFFEGWAVTIFELRSSDPGSMYTDIFYPSRL